MLLGKSYWFWIGIVWLAVLSYITLFWQLGADSMREWDEARNAVHATNMSIDGNYLVRVYNGQPDMWETKPPLYIWLQVVCLKFFGYKEWVFRLPSALAALATMWVVVHFLYKETKLLLPGVAATTILLTSYSYTLDHCARTADHDALLILFETCMAISFYHYLQRGFTKHLLYSLLFFTLAVFTKSIAVALLLPGLFIGSFYQLKILQLLKQPWFYVCATVSIFAIVLYYYIHEKQTPGYLQAVWENELFPRYFNSATTYSYHKITSPWQYAAVLFKKSIVLPLFVLSPLILFAKKEKYFAQPAVYFTVLAITFYIAASLGTYNSWYINPIIPFMAIVGGLGITAVYNHLWAIAIKKHYSPIRVNTLLFIVSLGASVGPVIEEINNIKRYVNANFASYSYGHALNKAYVELPELKEIKIYISQTNQSLQFYYNLYTKVYHYKLMYVFDSSSLKPADIVMCADNNLQAGINGKFVTKRIIVDNNCVIYKLVALR